MADRDELKRERNVCVECGREQPASGRGLRAYLTVDEDEPAEAVVYCPDRAEREFESHEK
jgi:hypothetical protein